MYRGNEEWLKNEIVNKDRRISDIARQFDKDITTIRYWAKKFNIDYNKSIKYPIKQHVCQYIKRNYIGFNNCEKYVKIAKLRIKSI